MPAIRLVLALCLLSCVWLLPSSAVAQVEVIVVDTQVTREIVRSTTVRSSTEISYDDCIEGDQFTFPVQVLSTTGSMELWIGRPSSTDCTDQEIRNGTSNSCQLLSTHSITTTSSDILVEVQNLIAISEGLSGSEACEAEINSDGQEITLFFIQVSSGTYVGSDTYVLNYDLVGPSPPTSVSNKVGEEQLAISYEGVSSDELSRYRYLCEPITGTTTTALVPFGPGAAGTAGVAGAAGSAGVGGSTGGSGGASTGGLAGAGTGATPSGGTGGSGAALTGGTTGTAGSAGSGGTGGDSGGSTSTSCAQSDSLIPGTRLTSADVAALPNVFECGSAADNNGTASGLVNDQLYAVAVVSVDTKGNWGPLSELTCGTPAEVDDFFETYRRAGGAGGGGFCGIGNRPTPLGIVLVGLALVALAGRRRRGQS